MNGPQSDQIATRVLLIEDDEDDYLLTRDLLDEISNQSFDLDWISNYDAGLEALRRGDHDVCLLDYRLGKRNGLELLREAMTLDCRIPIILLTGEGESDVDRAAMEAGAADYLLKGEITASHLARSIRHAIEREKNREDLRRLNAELESRVQARTAELARANEALKEADRRKDEFLAMLAHELRNPLAPLRSGLQLLLQSDGSRETFLPIHRIMERQLDLLIRLVNDLLDVSRITQGRIELQKRETNLAEIMEIALETSRPSISAGRHDLKAAFPPDPLPFYADPVRLAQAIANLLNNAAKYTPEGGIIRLSGEYADGSAILTVQDTGIGIPPELQPQIFEIFTQADSALPYAQGGLGIGLSLVKTLAELHGGGVEVFSEGLHRGSRFTIRFPLVTEEADSALSAQDSAGGEAVAAKPRRILIADDNRDLADTLALYLELQGHEVFLAYDGPAALDLARSEVPDLALLDIGLPGMSGHEIARRFKADPRLRGVVLCAITGWGQEEDVRRSRDAGFQHHLVKPVDLKALESLLDRF
jgi:signal transduction histidine kinase